MAEVIGDDPNAFIKAAKEKARFRGVRSYHSLTLASWAAFTGYDNALKGIVEHFWNGKAGTAPQLERKANGKLNFIGASTDTPSQPREIKRLLDAMGSSTRFWATTAMCGTRRATASSACTMAARHWRRGQCIHAGATISMQEFCTEKTLSAIEAAAGDVAFNHPVGVEATDRFLMESRACRAERFPNSIRKERAGLWMRIADRTRNIPRQEFAIYGDPDLTLGLSGFLLELGAEHGACFSPPTAARRGRKKRSAAGQLALRQGLPCVSGKDLWHMRSLCLPSRWIS